MTCYNVPFVGGPAHGTFKRVNSDPIADRLPPGFNMMVGVTSDEYALRGSRIGSFYYTLRPVIVSPMLVHLVYHFGDVTDDQCLEVLLQLTDVHKLVLDSLAK
jgi:hypothetical protein